MIDIRWMEKKTGRTLQNDCGYFFPETEKVLQWRFFQNGWGEWKDIPTIQERAILRKAQEK